MVQVQLARPGDGFVESSDPTRENFSRLAEELSPMEHAP